MSEDIKRASKVVEINTSTLVLISMVAGVGFAQIEVSTWWGIFLDTLTMVFNAVTEAAKG